LNQHRKSFLTREIHLNLAAFLILSLLSALCSTAAESHFTVDHWEAKEGGLPQNSVIAMTQTHDGYLWLGTQQGLARFDGVHFKTFNDGNTPGLNSTTITKLFEDGHANLWIGTENGGVVMVDKQGVLTRINLGREADESRLLDICEGQSGIVFLWLSNGDLYSYKDGVAGVLLKRCWRIAVENAGWTWIGTTSGHLKSFRYIPDSKPLAFEAGDELPAGQIDFLLASKRGGYWRFANRQIEKWTANHLDRVLGSYPWDPARIQPVNAACEDQDGNLVVGTGEGVFWFDASGKAQRLNSVTAGLSHNTILSLLVDREGSLWAGTDGGGLNRIKRQIFEITEGDHNVQSLCEDKPGVIWAVSGNQLVSLSKGKTTGYQIEQTGPIRDQVDGAVLEDAQGRVWAGRGLRGVFELQDNLLRLSPGSEFIHDRVFALYQDHNKKLWAGARNGLAVFDGSSWQPFSIPDSSSALSVHAIIEDSQTNLWIGTEGQGLKRLRNGHSDTFTRTNGLPSNNVSSLYIDHDDVLWVGTSGGLGRFSHGRWTSYSKTEGMITDSIAYITEDDHGNLWLGSTAGLMCVQKKELNDIASGAVKTALFRSFSEADGLPSSECSFGFQPAVCRTADGKLWFPTIRGIASVNPASLKFNTNPPPVIIESVLLDGVPQYADSLRAPPPASLKIQPGQEILEIDFASLNLSAPLKGRFKYRLEGFETTWTEKPGDVHFASYTKLPPGSYQFHVRACNEDGVWSDADSVLAVTVLPPFWRTWWFITATAICLLGMIVGSVYYVSTQKLHRQLESLRQQEALEKERARIARDLHDQLGANLTQVALLGELAEEDKGSPKEVEAHAKQISQTARETTHALDEIVWTVNPSNDTLDGLINYVCKYAQEYLAVAGLRYRLDVPPQLPDAVISPEVRHNVFLAAKEAVTNVVRHAQASSVWLRLILEPAAFTLEIQDDGRGPAGTREARAQSRNGLRNMGKRMEDVGGRFAIGPAPEGGTLVRLSAPIVRR
jgi:ligand-binding sensor domain-containing protein/signal transduction histidine kinase